MGMPTSSSNTGSVPSLPGYTKSNRLHSSRSLFWMGAPVRMKRCGVRSCLAASVTAASGFLTLCPSSSTAYDQSSEASSCAYACSPPYDTISTPPCGAARSKPIIFRTPNPAPHPGARPPARPDRPAPGRPPPQQADHLPPPQPGRRPRRVAHDHPQRWPPLVQLLDPVLHHRGRAHHQAWLLKQALVLHRPQKRRHLDGLAQAHLVAQDAPHFLRVQLPEPRKRRLLELEQLVVQRSRHLKPSRQLHQFCFRQTRGFEFGKAFPKKRIHTIIHPSNIFLSTPVHLFLLCRRSRISRKIKPQDFIGSFFNCHIRK